MIASLLRAVAARRAAVQRRPASQMVSGDNLPPVVAAPTIVEASSTQEVPDDRGGREDAGSSALSLVPPAASFEVWVPKGVTIDSPMMKVDETDRLIAALRDEADAERRKGRELAVCGWDRIADRHFDKADRLRDRANALEEQRAISRHPASFLIP